MEMLRRWGACRKWQEMETALSLVIMKHHSHRASSATLKTQKGHPFPPTNWGLEAGGPQRELLRPPEAGGSAGEIKRLSLQ